MSTVVEINVGAEQLHQKRREVQRRLSGVRRAVRAHLFWEGTACTIAAVAGLAVLSLLFDRLVRPELPTRLVLLVIGLAAVGVVAWRYLIQPLSVRLSDLDLAELLDRRRPGAGQRIANVLQLPELLERGTIEGSAAMIESAVLEDAAALNEIDLKATLNVSRRRKFVTLLAAVGAAVIGIYLLFPTTVDLWSKRWLAGSTVRWPQRTYLRVLGLDEEGKLLIPRGEATLLQVDALPDFTAAEQAWEVPGRGDSMKVAGEEKPSSAVPDNVTIEYTVAGVRKQGNFVHFEGGKFRYELPPLTEGTTCKVYGGDDWLGPVEIEPIARPEVKDLTITARIPGSEKPEVRHAGKDDAQLLYLPTTKIELSMESDQPLESANLAAQGTAAPELERVDGLHYRAGFEMKESQTLEFQLVSARGKLASKPYFLTIGLQIDRPPRVTIRSMGIGQRVTPQVRIPLVVRAVDDFGAAQMNVDLELTKLQEGKPKTTSAEAFAEQFAQADRPLERDVERQPMIKLSEYSPKPGDSVRLRGRAKDAYVLGSQQGESRWLTLHVVTPEELFYEILIRQRDQRTKFSKTLEAAKKQLEAMRALTALADAQGFPRVHQVTARQVWQIAGQLDAALQEMTYNELSSPAARELMETSVITPLRKLHGETLTGVAGKLQAFLATEKQDKVDEQAQQELVDAQQLAVDEMQKILRQMSQWEGFVDAVNQLNQVIKLQDDVLKSTKEAEQKRTDDLFN